jgi:NAD(P)-dependent dehydrogenase (short-subunit alcohol dehydrogenase family)
MAPSPRLQKLNALVHQEPYASLAYSIFWTWFLVAVVPVVAVCILPILAIYRLVAWYQDWWGKDEFNPRSSPYVDTTELAIVITGCDSGFGKELALWAAEAGFVVFAGCLSKDSFDHFKDVKSSTIIPMVMNVTSDLDVKIAADLVSKWMNEKSKKKRFLHALVNNAGITKVGFFDWLEVDDYRRVMEVNYFGVLRTCKAFLPMLKKQGIDGSHQRGSRIINLTSIAGLLKTAPIGSTYAASKHAAQSVTEALREELANFDIQVASVNPSFHATAIATSVASNLEKTWNDLSPAHRQEYGTGTFHVWFRYC